MKKIFATTSMWTKRWRSRLHARKPVGKGLPVIGRSGVKPWYFLAADPINLLCLSVEFVHVVGAGMMQEYLSHKPKLFVTLVTAP